MTSSEAGIFEWFQNSGTFSDDRRVYECYRFLTHSASILASCLDYDTTLTRVAELSVPYLADLCLVDLIEENKTHRRLAVKSVNPHQKHLTQQLLEKGLDVGLPFGATKILQTGKPEFHPNIELSHLRSLATHSSDPQIALQMEMSSLMAVPMLAHGKILGILTFIFSESKRHYNEKDLLVAQGLAQHAALAMSNCRSYKEMKNALRSRDQILAMVSHDLKNPVCAIRLNSDLLDQIFESENLEKNRKIGNRATKTIQASSNRMQQLINDLLDLSVLDAGEFKINKEVCEVQEIVTDALQVLRPLASQKSIIIADQIPDTPTQIYCDRDRILQVFSNIIGNAIKFTPAHGKIRVAFEQNENEARFTVADSGLGIPQNDLPHIFDRYWHCKKSEKAGAGLGLAIAKGIIAAHQGKIWVQSQMDKGSSFHFTLPAVQPVDAAQRAYAE